MCSRISYAWVGGKWWCHQYCYKNVEMHFFLIFLRLFNWCFNVIMELGHANMANMVVWTWTQKQLRWLRWLRWWWDHFPHKIHPEMMLQLVEPSCIVLLVKCSGNRWSSVSICWVRDRNGLQNPWDPMGSQGFGISQPTMLSVGSRVGFSIG